MGDRANIAVLQGDGSAVVLYTHSGGWNLPEKLHEAINRRARWDDTQYLSRIIFDAMSDGCQGEETGFGITTKVWDNGHPILVVDPDNGNIYTTHEKDLEFKTPLGQTLTFDAFAALRNPSWEAFK
jgi:hypothetical protein